MSPNRPLREYVELCVYMLLPGWTPMVKTARALPLVSLVPMYIEKVGLAWTLLYARKAGPLVRIGLETNSWDH